MSRQKPFLFLIPARGGSKRIPQKNIRPLGGIPLVGWMSRLARRVADVVPHGPHQVICSTDDEEIAKIATRWGASVPFLRPAEFATDEIGSVEVAIHVLDQLGDDFSAVVLLQPTSPLLREESLIGALKVHRYTGKSVIAVRQNPHPIEWNYRKHLNNELERIYKEVEHKRQQEMPVSYRPAGPIFLITPQELRDSRDFCPPGVLGFEVSAEEAIDIDTIEDFNEAEYYLNQRGVIPVTISGRSIGDSNTCFIIAEAGVNHNGSVDLALKLVDAAKESGADAIKFQTFKTEKVLAKDAPKAEYQKDESGTSAFDMIKKLELSGDEFKKIYEYCAKKGILFLSTPDDEESADLLDSIDVIAFKIGSGEITNYPLIKYIARKGKPLLISSGMSDMAEMNDVMNVVRDAGNNEVAWFHCVTNYPADPKDCNLVAIEKIKQAFGMPVGFSDHTDGIEIPIAAVARGANMIEKHFTLDKGMDGPDHKASLDPLEFSAMVDGIRKVESAIGSGVKLCSNSEKVNRDVVRRSIHVSGNLSKGDVFGRKDLIMLRPGTGLQPAMIDMVEGKRATRDLKSGEMLREDDFE